MAQTEATIVRNVDGREVPEAGVYVIDTAHTAVEFVARHMMITKVRGRFEDVTGQITIAEDPAASQAEVRIGTGSVSTGNADRDTHLRSADFFDAEAFPAITFASTGVRAVVGDRWELDGELTVRDVTRPVTLGVEFDGGGPSPFGDQRIGFSATTELDREDFGLSFNVPLEGGGLLVGRTARIELSVQAVATGDGTPTGA